MVCQEKKISNKTIKGYGSAARVKVAYGSKRPLSKMYWLPWWGDNREIRKCSPWNGPPMTTPNNSYKPIINTAWVRVRLCKLWKGCTRLAAASDKVYPLLAHGRGFSLGTPASSATKTSRHDIAEILLKVALNTINQKSTNDHSQQIVAYYDMIHALQVWKNVSLCVLFITHVQMTYDFFYKVVVPAVVCFRVMSFNTCDIYDLLC
jgi:hypothetical protein